MFKFRKKIKISELVELLATSQTYRDIANNKNDQRRLINVKRLSDEQKRELVLFNMFLYIQLIADIFRNSEIYLALRDHFNHHIYENTHSLFSTMTPGDFEILVEQRYYEYCGDFGCVGYEYTSKIGRVLWNNISGRETDGLRSMDLGIYSIPRRCAIKEYLTSIKRDYKIIID